MAIVGGQQNDEELNNPGGSGAKTGAATGGGGAYVGGGTGAGATTSAAPTTATPGGGGYTNLSSYLQANQDSGATTGQAAENMVGQAGSAAKQAQGELRTTAGNEIEAAGAGTGVNQGVIDGIMGYAGPTVGDSSQTTSSDPVVGDSGWRSASNLPTVGDSGWQNATNAPTVGSSVSPSPTPNVTFGLNGKEIKSRGDLSGYTQGLDKSAQAANQQVYDYAGMANGGQAGVSSLLKHTYQQPSYSAGENNLDSFLAGGTDGGKAALSQATGVAAGTEGGYKGLTSYLDNGIQRGQQTAKETNDTYAATKATKANEDAGMVVGDSGGRRGITSTPPVIDTSTRTNTATAGADAPAPTRDEHNPNNQTPGDIGKELKNIPAVAANVLTPGNVAEGLLPDPVTPQVQKLAENVPGFSRLTGYLNRAGNHHW